MIRYQGVEISNKILVLSLRQFFSLVLVVVSPAVVGETSKGYPYAETGQFQNDRPVIWGRKSLYSEQNALALSPVVEFGNATTDYRFIPPDHYLPHELSYKGYKFRDTPRTSEPEDAFPRFRPQSAKGRFGNAWGGSNGSTMVAPVFRPLDHAKPDLRDERQYWVEVPTSESETYPGGYSFSGEPLGYRPVGPLFRPLP